MNIAFWDNQLCYGGTSTSLYDYAHYNETKLGNRSFIFYEKNHPFNDEKVIEKFKKRFEFVHGSKDFKEVDEYLLKHDIKIIYIIKGGEKDRYISSVAKNCIHCVFNCNEPHGDVYTSIAPWVKGNSGKYPVVPHMINLPNHDSNMREELNIPKNAIVFGGYGGKHSFDIQFAQYVVYNIAKNNPHIYFLFANFVQFCPNLPNIIHLPLITDLDEKVKFINTIDAMLYARAMGETFGISIGEFSSKNKPIIASKNGSDLGHVHILKDKALWYNDANSLVSILLNFNPEIEKKKDWNAFSEYMPDKVMKIFKKEYLDRFMESKPSKTSIKYYLIHNYLEPERKEIMISEFKKWGFELNNIKWMEHPNKNEITEEMINKLVIQQPSYTSNILVYPSRMILRKGCISCTYKHYLCLKDIIDNNYDYGIIMEDNIYFVENIPKLVDKYIEQLDNYGEWDILFDCNWTTYIEGQIKPGLLVYPKTNDITNQCHGGTKAASFYLITNKCAKKLYENYIPFNNSPDWWMNDLFRKLNIKSFWVEPSVALMREHKSSVGLDL
jgi:GR25 family glycosyltransferase involved in LPS biosynthesis